MFSEFRGGETLPLLPASLAFGAPNANLKKVKEGQSYDFPSYLFQFWGNPQAPSASLFEETFFFVLLKLLAKLLQHFFKK